MLGGATAALGAIAVTTGAAALAIAANAARAVVTPPGERPEEVILHGVDRASRTVTVSATSETELPGRYSLWFDRGRGHARVGTIVGRGPGVVIRELVSVERGDLEAATHARWGAWYYLTPADLGVTFEDVAVDTEFGPAPAWLLPAPDPSARWIIQVHGRGVTRATVVAGPRLPQ